MTKRVVAPVRYPPVTHSRGTLATAIRIAEDYDAYLTVLYVHPYYSGRRVSQTDLKHTVEAAFSRLERTRYVVQMGMLIEETILEEVAAEDPDIVVIGKIRAGRIHRWLRKLFGSPEVDNLLRRELGCEIVTVAQRYGRG